VARGRPARLLQLLLFAIVLIAIVAGVSREWWLRGISRALIRDDGPAKADIAVVLAGDYWGNRITKGGDLVRLGYVPAALISGPSGFYGQHECEPEIAYAVRHGYKVEWFIPFPNDARSTQDEAWAILPELHRRNTHRMLLVTSDYHTGRALRTFRATERKLGGIIDIRVVAAPDEEFHADSWWRSRQGQKVTFTEWTKTLASALGL
jgi:uncharacterized SAM-binding protein YcdF (DUF218 family)